MQDSGGDGQNRVQGASDISIPSKASENVGLPMFEWQVVRFILDAQLKVPLESSVGIGIDDSFGLKQSY